MTRNDDSFEDQTQTEQYGESDSGPDSSDSSDTSSDNTVRDDGIETDVHGDVDTVS